MGTEFFWFYDFLLLAIFFGITFRCYKRGFVSSVLGMTAGIAALVAGVFLSGLLCDLIYDNFIKERAENYINQSLDNMVSEDSLLRLHEVDRSQIRLNGVKISEINFTPDSVGKTDLDLSDADLSATGIDKLNLEFFGLESDGLSSINAGKAVITAAQSERNSLDTLILASILAYFVDFPQVPGSFAGVNYTKIEILAAIIEFGGKGGNITEAVTDNLIAPMVAVPLRTLIFTVIFTGTCILLFFMAKRLTFINRIPLVGTVNSVLGIAVGALKSAVIIMLVCIGINILITVTGNTIIFINTMTIDESLIFKHVYNFRFINFGLM